MIQVFAFEGLTPVVHPSAYVHPSAILIGDVIIGPACYVGAGAVMRGDFGRIELRQEANFQDNCVAHSITDFDCIMEARSQIGHGAVIHGAYIGHETLIGMNAVVLDRARIGAQSIVGAMAMVKMGSDTPARSLLAGTPAKVIRTLTEQDIARTSKNADSYVELAKRSLLGIKACAPLHAPQAARPRIQWPSLATQV